MVNEWMPLPDLIYWVSMIFGQGQSAAASWSVTGLLASRRRGSTEIERSGPD